MQRVRYVLLVIAIGLLTIQLYIADYNNFWKWSNILNVIVPILLIFSLSGSIIYTNKTKEKS